ncbi:MAG: TIGR00269 family protein [Candidatus Pacearchaeota archaeon]|nr:TIGR00269 family protein [Candidatus Pacearchaeota archaeon]
MNYVLQSGKKLSEKKFCSYIERKVFKTIRKYKLIERKDKIAVACSGGKDSNTTLFLLNKFALQNNIPRPEALAIEEAKFRKKLLFELKRFCDSLGIELHVFSFKKEFGFFLDQKLRKIKSLGFSNCYVCSILKRYLLNKKARELGFTKVATGHSLDDAAENFLLNLLKGNAELLAKEGPLAGVRSHPFFVQRIKPLYFCSTKEIIHYSKIKKIPASLKVCPLRTLTIRVEVRKWLEKMEKKHQGVKNAIVNCMLKILPFLKQTYSDSEILECKKCGEPSASGQCKACFLLEKLL